MSRKISVQNQTNSLEKPQPTSPAGRGTGTCHQTRHPRDPTPWHPPVVQYIHVKLPVL